MTEQDSELINAASTGAAAAIAAVQNDQAEQERAEFIESTAIEATYSAESAAESAAIAVDTSTEAATIAESAAITAINAGETAEVAAEIAFDAKAEIAGIRDFFQRGMDEHRAEMQRMLDERAPMRQNENPMEVTVSHDSGPNSESQSDGTNSGSNGSSGNGSVSRRHKFGRTR